MLNTKRNHTSHIDRKSNRPGKPPKMNRLDDLKIQCQKVYLNIWFQISASIQFVGGTVESQSIPKVIPKKIDMPKDGGENMKIAIIIALNV